MKKLSAIDRTISYFSPVWGAKRISARLQTEILTKRFLYDGGEQNRTNSSWFTPATAGDSMNLLQLQILRQRAQDLVRNNPYASKAVRSIVSRIVGRGLSPESQAILADGTAFTEFRQLSKTLWQRFNLEGNNLGRPGFGGSTVGDLEVMILREVVTNGECFVRFVHKTAAEQAAEKLTIPLTIQIIEAERVVEDDFVAVVSGNSVFRGVEIDQDGRRVAYHVWSSNIAHPLAAVQPRSKLRIPADEMIHVYLPTRPGQLRGVSWFSTVVLKLKDIDSLLFNELTASTVAACPVLIKQRSQQSIGNMTLNSPSGSDTTDGDDNSITSLQPGMFVNLNPGETFEGFNPERPNTSATEFAKDMLRGVAAGLPCLKASQITMDFTESSFSAEKAAENEAFSEVEQLQSWFSSNCMSPIWSRVIDVALLSGFFESVSIGANGIADDYQYVNRLKLNDVSWRGPGTKSINPVQDETAARLSIANGTSSIQIEAAKKGNDYRQLMIDNAEAYQVGLDDGLPEAYMNGLLSIDVAPVAADIINPPKD
jgi:lambda family phage portal protein